MIFNLIDVVWSVCVVMWYVYDNGGPLLFPTGDRRSKATCESPGTSFIGFPSGEKATDVQKRYQIRSDR